eukprot:1060972-Amphidinium_carterae.1
MPTTTLPNWKERYDHHPYIRKECSVNALDLIGLAMLARFSHTAQTFENGDVVARTMSMNRTMQGASWTITASMLILIDDSSHQNCPC